MKYIICSILTIFGAIEIQAAEDFSQDLVSCFEFEVRDSPENSISEITKHKEVWCYRELQFPREGLYAYNVDGEKVRPELAFLIEEDGTMTHGSLSADEITFHRVNANEFNPFQVPLNVPSDKLPFTNAKAWSPSAQESLESLLRHRSISSLDFKIQTGIQSSQANSDIIPWRGYWWPYRGQPLSEGPNSPMAKLDDFVRARTLMVPGAASWESQNHRFSGVWWEGHCNGWVSSSVLRKEPQNARYDALSERIFTVDDQKGILAERDHCAQVAFFGNRNRERPTDDPLDIYPPEFHRTLLYYIGELKKPVAIDYYADRIVDNHLISAYEMEITPVDQLTYNVIARLTVHRYDGEPGLPPGPAPVYTRIYTYTLRVNENGEIVEGTWTSTNPDFLWVPLSPGKCSRQNPHVTEVWVQEISNLPIVELPESPAEVQ